VELGEATDDRKSEAESLTIALGAHPETEGREGPLHQLVRDPGTSVLDDDEELCSLHRGAYPDARLRRRVTDRVGQQVVDDVADDIGVDGSAGAGDVDPHRMVVEAPPSGNLRDDRR